ncbi:hypothetical protein J3R30DRAFT_3696519 [Lentinula aciculospora]|uniref:Uncharacterized protein n=1 Tax=Lentinula aciculospora TaxID=153920 RepID=A0A9W9AKX8_9AGAR|nr:hypothetical protein J3R30DRAFT_3696519 [Lentinula aciculospora]
MQLCHSRMDLSLKAYFVLLIGIVSLVYAAALPVSRSQSNAISHSAKSNEYEARIQFGAQSGHSLPTDETPRVKDAIERAIQQNYLKGNSVIVKFSPVPEIPDFKENRLDFDIIWLNGDEERKTRGLVEKVYENQTKDKYHYLVDLTL